MDDTTAGRILPDWLKPTFMLLSTIIAIALYAYILGYAIVRTLLETSPQFSEMVTRAAGLLSGLVGAVVAAGFAQGRAPAPTPVSAAHGMGGMAKTAWVSLQSPSRTRVKILGLAQTLGFPVQRARPPQTRTSEGEPEPAPPAPEPPRGTPTAMILGITYLVIYVIVGAAAFLVTVIRPSAPEILTNAGWVWLGTIVSSGYAFFALGTQQ